MSGIRHFFPGGNTCQGFYSLYEFIVPKDARLKLVLKGGPGVGKSTLMKKLGEEFVNMGHCVEFHWCSSDNESLDAMVLPDYDIAVIDGTAPHVVDPRFPGAVDEIVNLGEFWDKESLQANREEIIATTTLNSRYFALAYSRLREAKVVYDEWYSYYDQAIDRAAWQQLASHLIKRILKTEPNPATLTTSWPCRHLFAAAITPQGVVNHITSLANADYRIYSLKGSPGTGTDRIMSSLKAIAESTGLFHECYRHPFLPELVQALLFPQIRMAVVDEAPWLTQSELLWPRDHDVRVMHLEEIVDSSHIKPFQADIDDCQRRFRSCVAQAVNYLQKAKAVHDRLESYYIPAMNIGELEAKREELKRRILKHLSVRPRD